MATEVGENVQVKANLAFMAKVIAIVGTAVWGYSVIWNKINELDNSLGECNTKELCLAIYLLA